MSQISVNYFIKFPFNFSEKYDSSEVRDCTTNTLPLSYFVVDDVIVYFLSVFTFRYHFLSFLCYWCRPYPLISYLSLPYILPYLPSYLTLPYFLPHILPFITLPYLISYLTYLLTLPYVLPYVLPSVLPYVLPYLT